MAAIDRPKLGGGGLVWPLFALVALFLYLPILVMVVFSFNAGNNVGMPFEGFSLRWYEAVFGNRQIMAAMWNSLRLSALIVCLAVPLGLMTAIALDRFHFPGKALFRRLVLMPLVLPGIVTGVALLNLFAFTGTRLSLTTVLIGQVTSLMCITVTEVYARLAQMGRSQYEAAHDMGANEFEIFWKVTLPNARGAVIAAALITFSLSLDDLAVTFLLIGRENTLPMIIWSILRREATPLVNVVGTGMTLLTLVLVASSLWLSSRGRRGA